VEKRITVIKTGFKKFCKSPTVAAVIEQRVQETSRVSVEASMFANFHVLRCCEEGIPLEKLTQSFFSQTLGASYARAFQHRNSKASEQLRKSLVLYNAIRPEDYESIQEKKRSMWCILEDVAKTTAVNFKNWMTSAFQPYVSRWIRAHIDATFHDTEGNTLRSAKYVKSAVSLMYVTATNADGNVEDVLPSYKLLKELNEVEGRESRKRDRERGAGLEVRMRRLATGDTDDEESEDNTLHQSARWMQSVVTLLREVACAGESDDGGWSGDGDKIQTTLRCEML
jgi:hypothetical protein